MRRQSCPSSSTLARSENAELNGELRGGALSDHAADLLRHEIESDAVTGGEEGGERAGGGGGGGDTDYEGYEPAGRRGRGDSGWNGGGCVGSGGGGGVRAANQRPGPPLLNPNLSKRYFRDKVRARKEVKKRTGQL